MPTESVLQYLQAHRRGHVAKLFELLRIPSVANVHDELDSCRLAATWLGDYLTELGLDVEITTAGRPIVIANAHIDDELPTLLIYGHYDVQPPEPLELWDTPPFEPVERDGYIYARGANDDKGQLFTSLMAIEAYQRAGGGLPINVRLLLEGEEEIGSPNMEPFIAARAAELAADAALISDSEFFAPFVPSITYALRGVCYAEITLAGPAGDIHSGIHGGATINPINALAKMISAMHDDNGRVTIEGFYDDVLPLEEAERRQWENLPFDEAAYARQLGVDELGGGEKGYSVLERRWARPTLDCNGIAGGYSGLGAKTIIPSKAAAKVTMRLVANQDPAEIYAGLARFVSENTPPGIKAAVKKSIGARPVLLKTTSPAMTAAKSALAEAFEAAPVLIRCGASVPITEIIQRVLGIDPVLMGFGLPDDGLHAPNERFSLDQLYRGSVAVASLMEKLA